MPASLEACSVAMNCPAFLNPLAAVFRFSPAGSMLSTLLFNAGFRSMRASKFESLSPSWVSLLSVRFAVIDIPVMVCGVSFWRTTQHVATFALTKGHTAQAEDKTQYKDKCENPFHTDSLLS